MQSVVQLKSQNDFLDCRFAKIIIMSLKSVGRSHWSAQVDNWKNGRNLHIKGIWSRRGQKEADKKKLELPAGNWNKTKTPVSWFCFYPAIIKEASVPGHSHQDRVICAFIKQWLELLANDIKLNFLHFLLHAISNDFIISKQILHWHPAFN